MTQYGSLYIPPRRFRFLPRRFRTWLALLGGMLLITALVCYLLARTTPSWYQPLHITDPDVDALAGTAQINMGKLTSSVHWAAFRDENWQITQKEVNAFLAALYHSAASPQSALHAEIRDPMVVFSPGRITLCARSPRLPSSHPGGGVVSLTFRVTTLPPNPATTRLPGNQVLVAVDSLWLGALPVPASLVQSRLDAEFPALNREIRKGLLQQTSPKQVEKVMPAISDWLDHVRRGEPFTPDLTNDRGQKFAIKEVRVTADRFSLTLGPRP